MLIPQGSEHNPVYPMKMFRQTLFMIHAHRNTRKVWGKMKLMCTTVTQNATLQDKCCTAWGRPACFSSQNVVGAPDKLQRLEERGKMLSLKDIHSKDDNNNAYMDRFSSKLSLYYFIIYYYFHYILLLSLYTIFSLPFLLVETQTPKSNSCL